MKKGKTIKKKKTGGEKIDKKISFFLEVEPYMQQCVVICNGQFSDALKFMKNKVSEKKYKELAEKVEKDKEFYINDFINSSYHGRLYTELDGPYVMLVTHGPDWRTTTATVVHECLHLTHYVLRRAGVELEKESEEAFTYLCGNLVDKILNKIY